MNWKAFDVTILGQKVAGISSIEYSPLKNKVLGIMNISVQELDEIKSLLPPAETAPFEIKLPYWYLPRKKKKQLKKLLRIKDKKAFRPKLVGIDYASTGDLSAKITVHISNNIKVLN